jgi:hypothetical protein
MAKFLFVYHGGGVPKTEADKAKAMDAWGKWMGGMGSALVDGGHPVGKSSTVNRLPDPGDGRVDRSSRSDGHVSCPRLVARAAVASRHRPVRSGRAGGPFSSECCPWPHRRRRSHRR